MKILITVGGNDRLVIALPVEHAGVVATLLANASVYERDGYYSTSGWKQAEDGVRIAYSDGADLEPTHPKVAEIQKELSQKNSDWYKEYNAHQAAEKKLAETEAALAALQSVTTCPVTEPAPVDAEEAEEEPETEEPL